MKGIDDKDIISRLQAEATRAEAFTEMVDAYKQPLYWQIRRMVLCHDDADDILQNTFIKAWNGIASFRGDSKLGTWLYRIASNETLNFLERRHHPTVSIDDEEGYVVQTLQGDPYFDGDEVQLKLQQAISRLPARQRQVFVMKYYDEMKYEDMSQVLSTSVGALKASYHHAVKKITDFFAHTD